MRLAIWLTLFSNVALGSEIDAPQVAPKALFLGEGWRYRPPKSVWQWAKGLSERTFADLVSIPSNVDTWTGADLLAFSLVTAVSVAPMIEVDGRSLDSRLYDAIRRWRPPNCDYAVPASIYCQPKVPSGFRVWNQVSDTVIISTSFAVPLGLLVGGVFGDNPALVEAGTLAIEAVMVAQLYHLSLKLFTGREGPLWGDGAGVVHGPSLKYYPDGWPSGHAATLFALAGVYATYFDALWLRVLLLGSATFLGVMLVVDDTHFASDVVLGAALGGLIGHWVVKHRSTRFSYEPSPLPVRLAAVAPMPVSQGLGGSLVFTF